MIAPNGTDAIDAALRAGSLPSLLDALRPLNPSQRHELRAGLLQWSKRLDEQRFSGGASKPTSGQLEALSAALVICGTAKDLARVWIDDDLLVALCREFCPRALDGIAQALLDHSPQRIRTVQALIAAGLSVRPQSLAYVLGLIALPWVLRDAGKLQAALAADPGLEPTLLRVFEIEGTSDTSLASSDKYNHVPGLAWGSILLGLVERSVTTRAELLDKTLGALENDWPQYRSGWFSRFHAELAPDPSAMRSHLPRYLALCHSRIAPTVSLALDALAQLDAQAPLDGGELFEALRPVLAGAVKGQIEAALKLVDKTVKREPRLSGAAASLVAQGLLLESAPLQKLILKRLEAWGVDDPARALVRSVGGAIAAVNRPAWQRLAGAGQEPEAAKDRFMPVVSAPARREGPLDPERRLLPVTTIEELVECIAHVFENDLDIDAFERAVGGVVALAPFVDAQRRALAPVVKRAAKLRRPLPLALALARLLLAVVEGRELPAAPSVDAGGNPSPVQAVLLRCIDDAVALAEQGTGVQPLWTPTHRRGFIDPALMVERVAAHQAKGARSSLGDQVLGLLRLAPVGDERMRAEARRLADGPLIRALRYALGDGVGPGEEHALFAAAARIRHPGNDDDVLLRQQGDLGPDAARAARYDWRVHSWESKHSERAWQFHDLVVDTEAQPPNLPPSHIAMLRHPPAGAARQHFRWWSFGGVDEGSVCWSATLLPSCPDAFLAEGARAIGNNLDWWEAQWHNAAYLRLLLDPTCALGAMGTLLLALGMMGKEPGQTAIAVDALVQSHRDGRLDAAMLGETLRRLLANPLPKAARLRASLVAATRAESALRRPVFDALSAAVTAEPQPRELATLLDMLLELKLGLGVPLPPATRDALAAARLSGRARTLQTSLLE